MSKILIQTLPVADMPLKHNDSIVFYDKSENTYKRMSMSSLYENIYESYLKHNQISSMAFQTSSEYASYDHDHDNYNYVSYTNLQTGYTVAEISDSAILSTYKICLMSTDTASDGYQYNKKELLDIVQPKLGTVQYMTRISSEINVSSEDFDGWVYADGKQYETDIFESRRHIPKYFSSEGDNFTVPDIRGFATLNGDIDSLSSIRYTYSPSSDTAEKYEVNYNVAVAMIYVGRTTFSKS